MWDGIRRRGGLLLLRIRVWISGGMSIDGLGGEGLDFFGGKMVGYNKTFLLENWRWNGVVL